MKIERELILQTWFQASNETIYWNKMTNDRLSEINKNLISITSLLIPITGSLIFTQRHFNNLLTTLLCFALFFLFASIIFGFIQIFFDAKFFKAYNDLNAKRSKLYATNLNKSLDELRKIDENLPKPNASSGHIGLVLQSVTLALGLLSIIGIVLTFLF